MKFQKLSALLLIGVLLVASFTGCSKDSTETSETTTAAVTTEAEATVSDTEAATEAAAPNYEGVTLTILKSSADVDDGLNAVLDLATQQLGMKFEVETYVAGADGDNIIKTRLASGEMSDICIYNSGSLLAALNPAEYFADLSNEPVVERLDDTYKSTVTIDGALYGVPFASTLVGAMLYYKPDYEALGLSVPKTWDEFIANCDALEKAEKTAMVGTLGDNWTSQLIFLADNYNVLASEPDFPAQFQAGSAKYATTPAALRSFEKLSQVQKYYNDDYLATTYDDGIDMLANGEGTHWPMLTMVLTTIESLYQDKVNDIGVFPIPGDAPDNGGLTVWMPSSLYVNNSSDNKEAALAFVNFYESDEALDAYTSKVVPVGPYCIKGYSLPDNAYETVRTDMQAYFDAGKTAVALEFLTSVKGPNCASICQEVGSGQTTAQEAAQAYDEDCMKQALQLGLNWK